MGIMHAQISIEGGAKIFLIVVVMPDFPEVRHDHFCNHHLFPMHKVTLAFPRESRRPSWKKQSGCLTLDRRELM